MGFVPLFSVPPWQSGFSGAAQVESTYVDKRTRDRADGSRPAGLEVVAARKVRNWEAYVAAREAARANVARRGATALGPDVLTRSAAAGSELLGELDLAAGERWLFHGTGSAGLEGITDGDFRLDLAGTGAGMLYGRGVYLAESCTKADEYSRPYTGRLI